MNNEIGYRLKNLREGCGKTQKDIANVLSVTPAAYGKIEAGDRGLSSEYCIQLADYFGVTCDYLLRGVSSENIEICERTDLEQQTIDALEKAAEERREVMVDSIAMDITRNLKRCLINAAIQSPDFMDALAFEAANYCINLHEALNFHSENIEVSDGCLIKEHKARNALNASRFAASSSFDRFFLKFCSDSEMISAFAHLTEEQKRACIDFGLFDEQ